MTMFLSSSLGPYLPRCCFRIIKVCCRYSGKTTPLFFHFPFARIDLHDYHRELPPATLTKSFQPFSPSLLQSPSVTVFHSPWQSHRETGEISHRRWHWWRHRQRALATTPPLNLTFPFLLPLRRFTLFSPNPTWCQMSFGDSSKRNVTFSSAWTRPRVVAQFRFVYPFSFLLHYFLMNQLTHLLILINIYVSI